MFGVDDAAAAAMIGVGANILGTGGTIYAQGRMNRKTREWNEKMYEKQKVDAFNNWNLQNAYNSPEQQMTRLRQAGLNPNLVYGKGADNTAAAISQAKPDGWNPQVPKIDTTGITNAMSSYYDIKMRKAQLDNVAQSIATLKAEEDLKKITAIDVAAHTDRTKYDLDFTKSMKDIIISDMVLKNQTQETNIKVALNKMELDSIASSNNTARTIQEIAESKQRVLTSQLQNATLPLQRQKLQRELDMINMNILNADLDRRIKNIELDLRNDGINPNDPTWSKKLWQALMDWGKTDDQWTKNYKKTTYGGRPGFDSEGNRQTLYQQMKNPNYYR